MEECIYRSVLHIYIDCSKFGYRISAVPVDGGYLVPRKYGLREYMASTPDELIARSVICGFG
jgi:hypothetical protein